MKTAIISDIHANYEALKAVVDDFYKMNIDKVIVLGDIVCRGKSPSQIFELVKALKPIALIKGNTDDWINEVSKDFEPKNEVETMIFKEVNYARDNLSDEIIEEVVNLPQQQLIELEGKSILCVHGSDRKINEGIGIGKTSDEIEELLDRMEYDILLCGHTHPPYIVDYRGKLIINAGNIGMPDDGINASYGILEFDNDNFMYSIRKVKI